MASSSSATSSPPPLNSRSSRGPPKSRTGPTRRVRSPLLLLHPNPPCLLIAHPPTDTWMPYLEVDSRGEKVVSRVENYVNYHEGFGTLLRGKMITGILEQLNGDKMWLFKEKINVRCAFPPRAALRVC